MTTTKELVSVLSGDYLVLARDCFATGIHGVTRQPTEEGVLAAGTRVREVVTSQRPDPSGVVDAVPFTTFAASTDSGRTWYRQETWESPEGLIACAGRLRVDHVEAEEDE